MTDRTERIIMGALLVLVAVLIAAAFWQGGREGAGIDACERRGLYAVDGADSQVICVVGELP